MQKTVKRRIFLRLQRFVSSIGESSVPEDIHAQNTRKIRLISLMLYDKEKVGEVDFDSFTLDDLVLAREEIIDYNSDEFDEGQVDFFPNAENGLYHVNRLAHIFKKVKSIQSIRKKRRFF